MPNDNAQLPPTIHLGYLQDETVIAHVRHAKESIRFVGPGFSLPVAKVLVELWRELGSKAVDVSPLPKVHLYFNDATEALERFENFAS